MGQRAQGYRVRQPGGPGTAHTVRFRVGGRRRELSTGTADRTEAEREARRLYSEELSGKRAGPRVGEFKLTPGVASSWVDSLALRPKTLGNYEEFSIRWLVRIKRWDEAGISAYVRTRLREARRKTVASEVSALRGLLRWLFEVGELSEEPALPVVPKALLGVTSKQRTRVAAPELTKAEVRAFLRKLPEKAAKGWWVRPRCELLYETGLRPATIDALRVPDHWQPGSTELRITTDIDKEGFAREVPLTLRALAILKQCAPTEGVVFGEHKYYRYVRTAAKEAKALTPAKAAIFTGQHLRSARLTHLLDGGASLTAAAYLAGHNRVSTTAKYARPSKREAIRALKRAG
jgi:site-specific recombinase XerD